MENIWAFCIFAFAASITPGPTNLLILSTSHQSGITRSLPIILGASLGAALLVLMMGLGIGHNINQYPALKLILSILGGLWLSLVAWRIYHSVPNIQINSAQNFKNLGFLQGFFLQWINPKSWLMAIAVITVFLSNHQNYDHILIIISSTFFLIAIPCLFVWACLGKASQKLFSSNQQMLIFNRVLAVSLFISVWYPIFRI